MIPTLGECTGNVYVATIILSSIFAIGGLALHYFDAKKESAVFQNRISELEHKIRAIDRD